MHRRNVYIIYLFLHFSDCLSLLRIVLLLLLLLEQRKSEIEKEPLNTFLVKSVLI